MKTYRDLRAAFKREFSIDAEMKISERSIGSRSYSLDYVHWLENKVTEQSHTLPFPEDELKRVRAESDEWDDIWENDWPNNAEPATEFDFEKEITSESILQCSKEDGMGALTQVYFRKGARWMRDRMRGTPTPPFSA